MTSPSLEAWRKEAQRSLRDKPLESLIRKDEDGIAVEPLYSSGSTGAAPLAIPAGPIRKTQTWLVGQSYQRPSVAKSAQEIERDAGSGVQAFVIVLDRAIRLGLSAKDPRARELVGKGGVAVASTEDVAKLLAGIPAPLLAGDPGSFPRAHVFLDAGGNSARIAGLAKQAFEARGVAPKEVAFMAAIDPLGALASEGRLPRPMGDLFSEAHEVKRDFPRGRALLATGLPYHEAGATAAMELGAILATILEFLRAGFGLDDMAVAVASDGEVLRGVAKVRALRLLVAKAAVATGVPASQPFVLGVTSKRHLTARDAESNIVRGTVETFALGVGGADAVVTRSFDVPIGGIDSRAKRIGKNTQLILRDESYVGHGSDPARGSFAAEATTLALAEAAWNQMRAIEAEGGMARSLLEGAIQRRVARAHEERQAVLAKRKKVIVGVSEFAPVDRAGASEWPARDEERSAERSRAAALPDDPILYALPKNTTRTESAARLDRVRDSERFESLREEADTMAHAGGRPTALIVPLGARTDYQARVEYSSRLFQVGGFLVEVEPFELAKERSPDAIVLASSDAVYAASGAETLDAFRKACPSSFIVLAGRAGNLAEALAAVAPSRDVFVGADVVAILAEVLAHVRTQRASVSGGVR